MARNFTKQQVLEAINGSYGIYTDIAALLHCESHTAKRYVEKWEETKQAYEDETLRGVEAAEKVILDAIGHKDVATAKWLIEMKGKIKGYQRDAVLKLDNQEPLNIALDGLTKADLINSDSVEINEADEETSQ